MCHGSFLASYPLGFFLLTKIPCFCWRSRSFKALMTQFFCSYSEVNLWSRRQKNTSLSVCQFISPWIKLSKEPFYTLLLPAGQPIFTPIASSKNTNGDSWSPVLAMHLHFDLFCCSHGYWAVCITGQLTLSELYKFIIQANTGRICVR